MLTGRNWSEGKLFYCKDGRKVFKVTWWRHKMLGKLWGAKHFHQTKSKEKKQILKTHRIVKDLKHKKEPAKNMVGN